MRNITQTAPSAPSVHPSTVIVASVLADVVAVAAFVIVGRLNHDESLLLSGLLGTGWPFLIGLVGGYVGIALTGWPALSLRGGAVIAAKTWVIGLVLRRAVAGDGTPFSFVVVTILVLSAFILGWRLVTLAGLRRAPAAAGRPENRSARSGRD